MTNYARIRASGELWETDTMALTVLDHPLAGHLLADLRDTNTAPAKFRRTAKLLTYFLVAKATESIATREDRVTTPLAETRAVRLAQPVGAVPVLRAGLGMLESVVELFPEVAVGYIGLERHEDSGEARSYYRKLPNLAGKFCLCLDPMLATGGSASQAIGFMKLAGASQVTMVSVVAAPEGVAKLERNHPDINIVVASLDERLNDRHYIVPGLGDFGDRLYATP